MLKPYAEQAAEAQKVIENLERCAKTGLIEDICFECPYFPDRCDELHRNAADLLRAAYNKKGRIL